MQQILHSNRPVADMLANLRGPSIWSSDIFYVFNEVAALNASSSDTLLAAQMSGSWAAFAATGNPAPGTSKDATTLGDWPVAYSVATTGGTVPTEAIVNVIGG